MRLPPLTALRAFEAAARAESFTLAAQELCVTTGAVSRQVRLLESHLGAQLFARQHRKVVLTLAGQRYQEVIAKVFAELSEAGEALERDAHSALVRIDCVPTLAMHWLMPLLAGYHEEHPNVRVEVKTSLGPVDLSTPFDLAIRRDPRHFSGLPGVPFMTEWCTPICGRNFAKKHDLSTVEKMLHAPTIRIRAREDLWPAWTRKFGLPAPAVSQRLTLDHTFAALQAAEDNLGVVVIPSVFVNKYLSSGRLVAPFPDMIVETGKYFLLTRPDVTMDAVAHVRSWLIGQGLSSQNA